MVGTLISPFWVYGTITEAGAPSSGAIVGVQDITLGSATLNATTGANGKYVIEISSIADEADLILITVDTVTGKHREQTTSVYITTENLKVDFTVTGLTDPYWVYGTVRQFGAPCDGAVVSIQDITTGSDIVTETTGANGQFIINIQDIADNGDTIMVWVDTPTGGYKSETFVLDVSGPNMWVDMEIESPPCVFYLSTDTQAWMLTLPETITYSDGRILNILNLWDSLYVTDAGKNTENISLSGFEPTKDYINKTDLALDNGEEITINGFSNTNIDGVWVAENFTYTRNEPGGYYYNISLERVR